VLPARHRVHNHSPDTFFEEKSTESSVDEAGQVGRHCHSSSSPGNIDLAG